MTSLDVAGKVDDLAFDAAHHRVYVSGDGAVNVVEQRGPDDYRLITNVPTRPIAKTARLVPELNRYFVGVPGTNKEPRNNLPKQEPQILVYEVAP